MTTEKQVDFKRKVLIPSIRNLTKSKLTLNKRSYLRSLTKKQVDFEIKVLPSMGLIRSLPKKQVYMKALTSIALVATKFD